MKQKFSGEFHSPEPSAFSTEASQFCTLFAGRFTPAPRCPLISVKGHKTLSSNVGRARCGSQKLASIQVQWKMSACTKLSPALAVSWIFTANRDRRTLYRPVPKPPRRLSGALYPIFGRTKIGRGVGVGTPTNSLQNLLGFVEKARGSGNAIPR